MKLHQVVCRERFERFLFGVLQIDRPIDHVQLTLECEI